MTNRFAVIGGGIVGLATAREITRRQPDAMVTVYEKERRPALHQTGHNSGVVHAGIYYAPGSLKAQLCTEGRTLLERYCAERGIVYRKVGKLVVATDESELPGMAEIHRRAVANGVPRIAELDARGLREIEPYARGIAAVHSPETAATDYVAVAEAFAADVEHAGGAVRTGVEVHAIRTTSAGAVAETGEGSFTADRVIACAGLGTDRMRLPERDRTYRTVPFRGEYYALTPARAEHVRGMVYPVPDPRYPFLGVHLTRRWDDSVIVGPSALLALGLESYTWRQVGLRDVLGYLRFPGFWRMARQHWRTGVRELRMSLFKHAYAEAVRRYLPEVADAELVSFPAGVRAQALHRNGELVDDFVLLHSGPVTVVRNAPSPAATSSLAIARYVTSTILG